METFDIFIYLVYLTILSDQLLTI